MSISALTLIRPSPSVTGIISLKTCRTAGSRQSISSAQPLLAAVERAQPRHRQQRLQERRDEDRDRVDVELRVGRVRLRDADHEPGDDRDVPEHRRERRHGEVVVAVQDPDDDAGDAEQRDDREEDAREGDGEGGVVAGVAEEPDHPRRDQDEDARQRRQPEQHQVEEARRDAPGPPALALLEQVAEDGDERGREGGVGDERADQVRDLERDRERVDRAGGAEEVGGDHLAHEPEHAREAGRDPEDRGRDREPAAVLACRRRLADPGSGWPLWSSKLSIADGSPSQALRTARRDADSASRPRPARPGTGAAPARAAAPHAPAGARHARGPVAPRPRPEHTARLCYPSRAHQVVGTFRDAEHQAAEEARPDRR